jgi:hypothetical protein
MDFEQQMIYLDKNYKVLGVEQEFIIHPAVFDMLPISKASLQCPFSCDFQIKDYHLILNRIKLPKEETTGEGTDKLYEFYDCNISYTGAVLIGANLVKEYYMKNGKLACFSYQNVFELVFRDGILKTTVDQSKAMLRIRKNIELGLRNLNNGRDLRCIKRFINSSFVGDYESKLLKYRRIKHLKEMKKEYSDFDLHSMNTVIIEK